MIVSRTPFRVSLFGGGSDYPQWYLENGGKVLGFAINKYCHISLRRLPPFFTHKHRIVYSRIELVREIDEIEHPAARAVLSDMDIKDGLEIHHDGDLPARSGLGSSSSFTVGLLHALHAHAGRMATKDFLAREAIRIEQTVIKENVGSQDQMWAAHGGLNRIDFYTDGAINVTPLIVTPERRTELMGRLILFFTGISRFAHEVAGQKIANLKSRKQDVNAIAALVDEAQSILCDDRRPLSDLGKLLHESWTIKRGLAASVTNDGIDAIYAAALKAGATGGKLLGAGGGGFIVLYVEPDRRASVRAALKGLIEVDFDIDHSGSKIAIYQP